MKSPLLTMYGRNLHRIRTEMGLSQEDMAERIGFGRTYAGALERGERNVSLGKIEKYAAALGVDPMEFLRE